MVFAGSLLLMSFCLGGLVGAWLISRRHEKIYNHLFNEVLTNEQLNNMIDYSDEG